MDRELLGGATDCHTPKRVPPTDSIRHPSIATPSPLPIAFQRINKTTNLNYGTSFSLDYEGPIWTKNNSDPPHLQ